MKELDNKIDDIANRACCQIISTIEKYLSVVNAKPFLTQGELCELTGWSKRQLAYKRNSGQLSYIKRGRTIWYKSEDVLQWFEAGYVKGVSSEVRHG